MFCKNLKKPTKIEHPPHTNTLYTMGQRAAKPHPRPAPAENPRAEKSEPAFDIDKSLRGIALLVITLTMFGINSKA